MLGVNSRKAAKLFRCFSASQNLKIPRKCSAEKILENGDENGGFKWKEFVKSGDKSETFVPTEFGHVRFDSQNVPKIHGEFDDDNSNTQEKIVEEENSVSEISRNRKKSDEIQVIADNSTSSFFLENEPSEKIPEVKPKVSSKIVQEKIEKTDKSSSRKLRHSGLFCHLKLIMKAIVVA